MKSKTSAIIATSLLSTKQVVYSSQTSHRKIYEALSLKCLRVRIPLGLTMMLIYYRLAKVFLNSTVWIMHKNRNQEVFTRVVMGLR